MKSPKFVNALARLRGRLRRALPTAAPAYRPSSPARLAARALLPWTLILLASCSSLGKPERQPSPAAPACNQREPARDSGDPPSGAAVFDWMAWAQAYTAAQWAIVDRDNKRAATADCLDDVARAQAEAAK